jgi:hypothetical protein
VLYKYGSYVGVACDSTSHAVLCWRLVIVASLALQAVDCLDAYSTYNRIPLLCSAYL